MRRALYALLVALPVVLTGMPVASASTHATSSGSYYLALGDSLAFGYQPTGDWTHGYAQDLYSALASKNTSLQFMDLGCKGETTSTFLGLKNSYCVDWQNSYCKCKTPQMQQALNFIKQHPGQIAEVTIDVGADDLTSFHGHPNILKEILLGIELTVNLAKIDKDIRTAVGSNVPIVTMTYYNPWEPFSKYGDLVTLATELFNGIISGTAKGQHFLVANVYNTFNKGTKTQQQQNMCNWTYWCSTQYPKDVHANSTGYTQIESVFAPLLGA